jgi:hypothetical protein
VSDTPLYDATLSDVLARVRWEADARVAPTAEAVRAAQLQAMQAEQELRVLRAELDRLRREAQVRAAFVRDEVEDAVRAELVAAAPPLLDLSPDEDEPLAPPIPSFDSLRTSSKRLDAFFDSLIGP